MSNPGNKNSYFPTTIQLNYPSPKIPFTVFPHIPTSPPPLMQPSYYLIILKVSQKPGFSPKVLNRGHNLADKDCGMFGSVFPGLLYTE